MITGYYFIKGTLCISHQFNVCIQESKFWILYLSLMFFRGTLNATLPEVGVTPKFNVEPQTLDTFAEPRLDLNRSPRIRSLTWPYSFLHPDCYWNVDQRYRIIPTYDTLVPGTEFDPNLCITLWVLGNVNQLQSSVSLPLLGDLHYLWEQGWYKSWEGKSGFLTGWMGVL